MIEGLKPYAEYKESGLPWLGRCPKNWSVRRTKILFHERVEKGFPNEPLLAATQTKGVVKKEDYGTRTVTAQKDLHLLKLVEVGDYVISLRSFQGGIEVAHCRGIISPAYTVLKPRKTATSGYYSHFFKAKPFIDSLSLFVTGIREGQNIDYERLSRAELPMPSEDEQAAIVRFLDHANRKIDGFIRAKRKLIELLSEQKQAIVHRAVTRGLHPDVPLKPSGIPWLGDIPVSWTVAKLKHLTRFQNGLPFKPADWKAEGIPIIRIQNLNGSDDFNYTIKKTLPTDLLIRNGDLMFAWSGNKGTSFGSFQWDRPFDGYLNQHIFKLTGFKIPRRYFYYVLRAVTRHVEEQAGGIIGLVHVTKPELGSVQVPIASAEEQENIAQYIDVATAALTTVIARTDREIALMQEYRTRLTADLVTGKLDVREAAVMLPDHSAEINADTEIEEPNGAELSEV